MLNRRDFQGDSDKQERDMEYWLSSVSHSCINICAHRCLKSLSNLDKAVFKQLKSLDSCTV